jgi:phosphatidylglycerophosphate synthase
VVTRAYIVDAVSGGAAVGGLTVLLRQALSLQDAGVDGLIVVGGSGAAMRSDARVRLRIDEAHADGLPPDATAIVVSADVVWHPSLVKRLSRTHVAADEVISCRSPGGDAALYLCGRDRVRSVVLALAARRVPVIESVPFTLEPREFVASARTDGERRRATTLLLRSLAKPSDGLASRHLHRPISRLVTRALLSRQVTPNAMTLFAAVFGVAGAFVAARGGYWNVLAGTGLFEVQNILDGCDGEIARLKYLRSRSGEWLDQVIDDALNIAILASIGVALARGGHPFARTVTIVAVVAQAVHVAGLYAGLLIKAGGRGSVARLRWWIGSGEGGTFVGDLTRRDILSAAYVAAAAMNGVAVVFLWHAALTVGSAVVTTLQWIVWGGPGVQAEGDGAAERAGSAPA